MKEEGLDKLIKDGLAKRMGSIKVEKTDNCPSEAGLSNYLEGSLSKAEERSIREHVKSCYWCIEQLDQAQRAMSALDIKKARKKTITRANLINWIKKNKWLIGAGITFILSFVFSGYFLQFLILTLLMGIKWIFTTGGTKTIIMIYDALRKKDRGKIHKGGTTDRFSI